MLANEMKELSRKSRNENSGFQEQWNKMEQKIKEYATKGENKCTLVYGRYNEQLIEKLRENGFKVDMACNIFPHIHYGMPNSATHWVLW